MTVFADFGLPDAVTTQGQDNMVWLWRIFLIGAVAVSALIWILVIISVIRFRRRSDEIPSQKQYNIPLEIGYTIAPAAGRRHPVRSHGVRPERIHVAVGAAGGDRRGRGLPVAVAVPLSRRRRHGHRQRAADAALVLPGRARRSASTSCPTTSTIRSGCPSSSRSATSSPASTTRSTSTITEPGRVDGPLRRVLRPRPLADEVRRHRRARASSTRRGSTRRGLQPQPTDRWAASDIAVADRAHCRSSRPDGDGS